MDKNLFVKEIKKHFNCSDEIFNKIEKYKELIIYRNKEMNLTRLSNEDKIYLNYFFESIIVYKDILENKNYKLLDIGSGSGIPGILINLFFPKIEITIIESNQKKCLFMEEVIKELNLKKIKIICKRAENILLEERESFDFVTSRAVANLKILLEISAPYLKIGGLLIEPKSNNLNLEIEESKKMIDIMFLKIKKIIDYNFFNRFHKVIILEKIKENSLNFPRSWKEIKNNE